jgi:hypothetical protein
MRVRRLSSPNIPWLVLDQICKCLKNMAGTTRLELATSAVTGQRSNQLNYVPRRFSLKLSKTRINIGFPYRLRFPPFPRNTA